MVPTYAFRMLNGVIALIVIAVLVAGQAWAESAAPSVHWGAIMYPDQGRLLDTGLTFNRFTEFNASRHRYNAIRESAGFNFATVSWTEHWLRWPGWSTNLTVGAGPTYDQPTNAVQNQGVHRWLGFNKVPVEHTREAADVMIDASATRWLTVLGNDRTVFAGGGVSLGSIYQELFARAGVRRFPIADLLGLSTDSPDVSSRLARALRFSAMGRYSQVWSGAAYHEVSPQTYLVQLSLSIGDYERDPFRPRWEFEFAYTIHSGLFVDPSGHSIEEQFASAALRIGALSLETWNDSVNPRHDFGPTYGGRVMIDLFRLFDL